MNHHQYCSHHFTGACSPYCPVYKSMVSTVKSQLARNASVEEVLGQDQQTTPELSDVDWAGYDKYLEVQP